MLGFFAAAKQTFLDHFEGSTLPWVGNTVTAGGAPSNKLRNSRFVGSAVGTFPTYWSVNQPAGLSSSITAIGTTTLGGQSVPYVDLRVNGTATATGNILVTLDTTDVTIASGQTWTMSGYVALQAGTLTNLGLVQWGLEFYESDGSSWNDGIYPAVTGLTSTLARFSDIKTVTAETPPSVRGRPIFAAAVSATGAVDVTFRLAGPMAEQSSSINTLVQTSPGDESATGESKPGLWYTRYPFGQPINSEQQWYQDVRNGTTESGGVNPFSVANSVLTITSTVKNGSATTSQPYISGAISTAPPGLGSSTFSQQYGYFEYRARFYTSGPTLGGQGMWPAFWLMPMNIGATGGTYGEIDIMEWIGGITTYACTIHKSGPSVAGQDFQPYETNGWSNWHTYGVEWKSDFITYYWDRKPARNSGGTLISFATQPEHRTPYYLLLNTATGGNWPGPVSNNNIFPCIHEIDYVKVWDRLPF